MPLGTNTGLLPAFCAAFIPIVSRHTEVFTVRRSSEPSPSDDQPSRPQSILDRAFNGPGTSNPTIERTSWLENDLNDTGDTGQKTEKEPDPVPHQAEPESGPAKRSLSYRQKLLLGAAVITFTFFAGYLVRSTAPTNAQTNVASTPAPTVASTLAPIVVSTPAPVPTTIQPVEQQIPESLPSSAMSFEPGSSAITTDHAERIEAFVESLPSDSSFVVIGSGDVGLDGPLNMALGKLRADTVAAFALESGLDAGSLLVATGKTDESAADGTVVIAAVPAAQ